MSYSKQDDQVTLTMSREDYELLSYALLITAQRSMSLPNEYYALLNRLNQGNPNYTPYRGGEKKS